MDFKRNCEVTTWLFFVVFSPLVLELQKWCDITFVLLSTFIIVICCGLLKWACSTGGPGWENGLHKMGLVPIPGSRGIPIFGNLLSLSHGLAHRTLACMAASVQGGKQLMAFSLGSTRAVVTSDPSLAREILTSPHFASRPIKDSAKRLMFSRAIGFAPDGPYWRMLRKVASNHLFATKRILAHEAKLQLECTSMLNAIAKEQSLKGIVQLRKHLQSTSLKNIMQIMFGKRYGSLEFDSEANELHELVREGFELLGAFNWSDHLSWLKYFYDPLRIQERCAAVVPRVTKIVKEIIDQRQINSNKLCDDSDFVDVLLSLECQEKLDEDDMVVVLWEMIFRGTDTTTLLTEWIMAELVLNPKVQETLYNELQHMSTLTYSDISKSPYLQAVVKETLRLHPPGPLLSWARLSTSDVLMSNGMVIPSNTTTMVNMWAITHDSEIWDDPFVFNPDRFLPSVGGITMDVRGNDLRLAPFGAGRRICPGKTLGLATVSIWVANLVHHFKWIEDSAQPVNLSEELKLSCEMKNPLMVVAIPRITN